MDREFRSTCVASDIKLSYCGDALFKTNEFSEDHKLVWIISGESRIIRPGCSYVFRSGDIFLIPRNNVTTIINYPTDRLPHRMVVMNLSVGRLREFYNGLGIVPRASGSHQVHSFKRHPLLKSCLLSLAPYFDLKEVLPEHIASLKIAEALTVLRIIDNDVDGILANFEVTFSAKQT
ncbi:MAG: hypothetical protein WDN75_10905 [Bacteroidota bacterium]